MRIPSRTCRAMAARSASSTLIPDSLAISMLTVVRRSLSALARATGVGTARTALRAPLDGVTASRQSLRRMRRAPDPRVVTLVGIDDVADKPVPHHVVAGQPCKVQVIQTLEDVLHLAEPAGLARGQVHLGDVARDHHPGAEPEPGEEHLHLFRDRKS